MGLILRPMQTEQKSGPKPQMDRRCRILLWETHGWRRLAVEQADVWVKGDVADKEVIAAVRSMSDTPDSTDVQNTFSALHGHFAVVVHHTDWVCAAVDRIRSIPLVWANEEALLIAQEGRKLLPFLDASSKLLDLDQALAVALSGFTIGDATIYRAIHTLLPGHFLFQKNGSTSTDRYHRFDPWKADQTPGGDAAEQARLAKLTLSILQELIDRAGGRKIAIPLSAGLDSRLIAAGLKHLGYDNVVTFAYGRSGNHEAETSRVIAESLGYPWHFVPFTNKKMAEVFTGKAYGDYRAFADSLTGVHFPQDFAAIAALLNDGTLSTDDILVNGQSGDFITGNHVPASLATPFTGDQDQRMQRVVDALVAKHFKQWRFLMRDDVLVRIGNMLRTEITSLTEGNVPDDLAADYGLYEVSEFVDRQSKYVVNGQRLYEFFDLEWSLPLWHDRYLEYWAERPLSQKARQRLYRDMLMSENWAGVWQDIPVNAKRIRPRWLIPIRFACKVLHAPLGKDVWHRFERRAFEYLMTPLCTYASRGWFEVAMDSRGPWNGLCPHIEDYLCDHGIDINNLATEARA